jgi:3-hydroxyacyl-CoA dehydrogenase / enoyl-CoA hydratase / 3-hydroxybutyryl-CoA epimerase
MRALAEVVEIWRGGRVGGDDRSPLPEREGGRFIAGADIDAIEAIESPDQGAEAARRGQAVFGAIEALPVPTLAAIHGACMGGGTELALACRYRVISDHPSSRMGLPEVQLGILPGLGGTTRLPRLIGLQAALDLLLTGKTVSGGRRPAGSGWWRRSFPRPPSRRPPGTSSGPASRRDPSPPAPAAASLFKRGSWRTPPRAGRHPPDGPEAGHGEGRGPLPRPPPHPGRPGLLPGPPVEKALEEEARAAGELLVTRVSKNLIHVFRLRERPGRGRAWRSGASPTRSRPDGGPGRRGHGGRDRPARRPPRDPRSG